MKCCALLHTELYVLRRHKVAMAISGDMPYAEKKLEAEKIKSQFLEELADTQ